MVSTDVSQESEGRGRYTLHLVVERLTSIFVSFVGLFLLHLIPFKSVGLNQLCDPLSRPRQVLLILFLLVLSFRYVLILFAFL